MIAEVKPYERVVADLRARVAADEWLPGTLIPGRRALAKEYGVACATLERAAGMLIAEGILTASDRRGTFVAAVPSDPPAHANLPPSARHDAEPLAATIGIAANVVPYQSSGTYESQWPVQVLHGCEDQLAGERGLTMRFLNTVSPGQPDLSTADVVARLLDEGVSAIIVIGGDVTPDFTARFAATHIPLVFAAYDKVEHPFPQVYADDVAAGTLAARHLLERGYRRLLYFQPFAADWITERLAGVKAALGKAEGDSALRVLPAAPGPLLVDARDQKAMARQRASEVFASDWTPGTGVVAPNDAVAEGFMEAARERGLEAGRDYGLVGFDDRARECGLTSLRPPLAELGGEAAALALRLLRGESAPARIALQHRLMARSSTAP